MKWGLRYLANGFEAYEASVFTDVLGWKRVFGDMPVEVTTGGRRRKLKCTWNFTVIPETKIDQVNPKDYNALAIPGGFEKAGFYEDAYHEDSLELIRVFNEEREIIASVCVGALSLGKSCVLKGCKGTRFHLLNGMRRKQLAEFGADVLDQHGVVEGF